MRTGSIDTLSNLLNTNWLNHLLIILTLCYQHICINTISSSIRNCGICQHHKKVQALTYTHRENRIWTVSQHCLCAHHRYWQGGTLARCRAQALSPQIDCQHKNRRNSKGKMIARFVLFPALRVPPGSRPDSVGQAVHETVKG